MDRAIRSRHPLDRCKECGQAYVWIIHESGYDEEGGEVHAVRREVGDHSRKDCIAMQVLERETWPTLPF